MSETEKSDMGVIRMNVYVDKYEHPLLYAELIQFAKGSKRVQRLKTMASERILLGAMVPLITTPHVRNGDVHGAHDPGAMAYPSGGLADEDERAAVHEFFAPPIKDK